MRELELGGERVRIQLGSEDSYVIERYEIRQSFFTQPGTFALRVGHGKLASELINRYRPGVSFALWIDLPDGRQICQMTGRIDHVGAEPSSGATEITLRGRDWMMPLNDGMPRVERTFGRATFLDLTESVIKLAGVEEPTIFADNEANRAAVQGVPKVETVKQVTREYAIEDESTAVRVVSTGQDQSAPFAFDVTTRPERIVQLPDTVQEVKKVVGFDVPNPLKISLGTTYLRFLQQEHNRTGLFLLCACDAPRTYILARPNVAQAPAWRLVRRRGASAGIISARFSNDTSGRFSHYMVRGRGGGDKDGRKQIAGEWIDQEMVDLGLSKVWSHVDSIAKSSKQAEYLARRMGAEKARAGWSLSYTLRGLTWPTLGGERAVWSTDAIVDVQDEELGIFGPHWISDVAPSGGANGATSTTITLHRPEHQIYGDEVLPERVTKGKKR